MSQTYIPAELRRLVRQRAGERCEYCLIPEALTLAAHEVDHMPERVQERELLLAAGFLPPTQP
jgi:hypothetical protein